MKNPFEYGGVVDGSAFCNRKKKLSDLVRAMENSEKLFLYSERRLEKTSLIHYALSKLPRDNYASAYVDLWASDGEVSFVTATAKAITESMGRNAEQLLDTAKRLFTHLVPSVTVDSEGKPKVTFGVSSERARDPEIEEVLMGPAKIAAHGKKKVAAWRDLPNAVGEHPLGQKVDLQPPRQVPQIPALRSADRARQGSTADAQGRCKRRMGVSVKESPIRPYHRSRGFQAVAGSQTVGRYSRSGRPVLCSPSFLNRRDGGHRKRNGGHGCDGASISQYHAHLQPLECDAD